MKQHNFQSIFIQCPNWVGDFIMATPVYRALREHFPTAHITLCMKPGFDYLIKGSNWYNEIIFYNKSKTHKGLAGWRKLTQQVRQRPYDLAVILPNSVRSGIIGALTQASMRIGYQRPANSWLLTHTLARTKAAKGSPHRYAPYYTGEHYAKLLELLDLPRPSLQLELPLSEQTAEAASQIWHQAPGLDNVKLLVVPGASFGASKLWPPEHFARLLQMYQEQHQAKILIPPGPGETEIAQAIAEQISGEIYIHPPSSQGLELLKGLIAQADLVICNDTGPRHIAHAFRRPSVVLMGPTNPELTYTPLENAIVLRKDIECSPCQQKVCPLGHHRCMRELLPEYVYQKAEEFRTTN